MTSNDPEYTTLCLLCSTAVVPFNMLFPSMFFFQFNINHYIHARLFKSLSEAVVISVWLWLVLLPDWSALYMPARNFHALFSFSVG